MLRHCICCDAQFESMSRLATCETCRQACLICGGSHKLGGLCAAHEMRRRRAGMIPHGEFIQRCLSGEPVGLETRQCEVCGHDFHPRGEQKFCSHECRKQYKRPLWRADYHALPDDRKRAIVERRKASRHDNPELARGENKRKWERIVSDPQRLETQRQKAREHYARHAREIQARRRERFSSLAPDQQRELKKRMAAYSLAYSRTHGHKYRGAQNQYRQQKRLEKIELEMLAMISGDVQTAPARKCNQCKTAVVRGKAIYCNACRTVRQRLAQARCRNTPQTRICIICCATFPTKTNSNTCSEPCRLERRKRTSHGNRRQQDT